MPQTKTLEIERLQPTQQELVQESLDFLVENPVGELPEVWMIGERLVIGDGHHRIYTSMQQGQTHVKAFIYTEKNTLANHAGVTKLIGSYAQECQQKGITTLSDLSIVQT